MKMMGWFLYSIYKLNSRHPIVSIVATLSLTFILLLFALNLTVTFDNLDFMPHGSENRHNVEDFESVFGGNSVTVIITAPDVADPEVFEMIHELTLLFEGHDQVKDVDSPSEALYLKYRGIPDKDIIEAVLLGTPVMPDRSSVAMTVYLHNYDKDKGDAIAIELLRIVDFVPKPDGSNIKLMDEPVISYMISKSVDRTIVLMFICAVILMILLLYLISRYHVRGRFMPFAPILVAIISVIWVLGLLALFNIPLTPILTAFLPILIGMSIDYGVVIQNRYEEEVQAGSGIPLSLYNTIMNTGPAMSIALITTLLGFGSLLLTGVPNLQYFGFALSIGLVTSFIISIVFITALVSLKDKCPYCDFSHENKIKKRSGSTHSGTRINGFDRMFYRSTHWLVKVSIKHGMIILLLALLVFSYGAANYGKVRFISDPLDYFPKDIEFNRNFAYLESHFGQGEVNCVVVTGMDVREPVNLEHILEIERYVASREDSITRTSSIASVLSNDFGGIPSARREVDHIINTLPQSRNLVYGNSRLVIMFHTKKLEDEELSAIVESIRRDIEFFDPFLDFYIAGSTVYKESITRGMVSGQNVMTVVSLLLVFSILLLIHRSVSKAGLPLLPVLVVVAATIACMQFFKIPHTMLSASINTVIIGTGIDYSVHLIERYEEEIRNGLLPVEAIQHSWGNMGRSVFTAAATTAGGFLAMKISPFPMFQYFGTIAFISICLTYIITLVMLPYLLLLRDDPARLGCLKNAV